MTSRQVTILAVLTTVLVAGALVVAVGITAGQRPVATTNPLKGRPDMVHRLVMIDSAEGFSQGDLEHAVVAKDLPQRIVLRDARDNTYPRYGYWQSAEVPAAFAFTELIPSWNASTPPKTGVRFQVRVRDARNGKWSPWLYVGKWGRTISPRRQDQPITQFDHGIVNVDNIVLDRPADAFQVRASLQSFDLSRSVNPSLRRVSVVYSGSVPNERDRARLTEPVKLTGAWAGRNLSVPFRAQGDTQPAFRGQSCSPTSLTMVMAYWGIDVPADDNAAAIYDPENDLFGNWNRAVQRAAELGLDGYVTRLSNWDQVKAFIESGIPVIASINFDRKDQFPSALYDSTDGHLIVIRGFTPDGDVIVNDPASRDKGNGVIYKPDELARAWFTNAGGVSYIISRPTNGSKLAAKVD